MRITFFYVVIMGLVSTICTAPLNAMKNFNLNETHGFSSSSGQHPDSGARILRRSEKPPRLLLSEKLPEGSAQIRYIGEHQGPDIEYEENIANYPKLSPAATKISKALFHWFQLPVHQVLFFTNKFIDDKP
ncbi:hypothetical protein J3R30DRAFT_165611 [Lentinula aciculospora]|uniref:Uncharacterized protein n=1 Tax=Lentinula aciculospora TaxID=153920 RepID=A0A9W9AUL4_9AGAR|nr:hypothetical protein J3R30DRAFT_165611 [Lentinula aciculospora]